MKKQLGDKTILFCGSSEFLATSLANSLCEKGANLAIIDNDVSKIQRLTNSINEERERDPSFGRALAYSYDFKDTENYTQIANKVAESFGSIDVYIDAQLSYFAQSILSKDFPLQEAITKNLLNPCLLTKSLIEYLSSKGGKIIYLVPEMAVNGSQQDSLLSLSRSSLIHFCKSIATELRPRKITVNCLGVGPTEDYLYQRSKNISINKGLEDLKLEFPKAQAVDPSKLSDIISFLASSASDSISGQYWGVGDI